MSQTPNDGDQVLERFGYHSEMKRVLRDFSSFAIVFSFISVATGVFTTYGIVIGGAGPRGIWSWPLVCCGQILVALVLAALAGRIPVSGMSYQWMTRLTNPSLGWILGWAFLGYGVIVGPAVNLALTGVLAQLLGLTLSSTAQTLITIGITLIQASFLITSTRVTARVNNLAVWTELTAVAVFGLVLVIIGLASAKHGGGTASLGSTGTVPHAGYWYIFGPFFGTVVLGAFTFTGFDSAAALADETTNPHRAVPRGIIRATVLSALMGMLFLIGITLAAPGDWGKLAAAASPVGEVAQNRLGSLLGDVMIVCVAISIFANSLINMTVQTRLIWAISRDGRFPLSTVFHKLRRGHDTPANAIALATVLWVIVTILLNQLSTLVAASSIIPVGIYLIVTLAYASTRHRYPVQPGGFSLGRFDRPVTFAAVLWSIALIVLLVGPKANRTSAWVALAIFASGAIWLVVLRVLAPAKLTESAHQGELATTESSAETL